MAADAATIMVAAAATPVAAAVMLVAAAVMLVAAAVMLVAAAVMLVAVAAVQLLHRAIAAAAWLPVAMLVDVAFSRLPVRYGFRTWFRNKCLTL
jgi:hypothetical protein